jgi:cellulose biosynthesis protein BcsQ
VEERSVRILAIHNIKGGVGKTATAVNLGWLAARAGRRTLLWDLDPQAASTFYLRVKPKIAGGGKRLVRGKLDLDRLIKGSDFDGLDLLPADFSYRKMDIVLDGTKKPKRRLGALIEPLAVEYDLVVFDCPPGMTLVSESVFGAADALLVPTIPTTLSLRTLDQLARHLGKRGPSDLPVLPFFSMVDRRKSMHRSIADEPRDGPFPFLATAIPYSSVVEKMGVMRTPVGEYSPRSRAATAYRALYAEVAARVFGSGGGAA